MAKTPKKWTNNLNNKIITADMLGCCIYSLNKRAKNFRDKEYKLKQLLKNGDYHDTHNDLEKFKAKKKAYYATKDLLLSLVNPDFIQKENGEISKYDKESDSIKKYGHSSYFLHYRIDTYSFHTPIQEEEVQTFKLNIKEIHDFSTNGEDLSKLASIQFCNKLVTLVESKQFTLLLTS